MTFIHVVALAAMMCQSNADCGPAGMCDETSVLQIQQNEMQTLENHDEKGATEIGPFKKKRAQIVPNVKFRDMVKQKKQEKVEKEEAAQRLVEEGYRLMEEDDRKEEKICPARRMEKDGKITGDDLDCTERENSCKLKAEGKYLCKLASKYTCRWKAVNTKTDAIFDGQHDLKWVVGDALGDAENAHRVGSGSKDWLGEQVYGDGDSAWAKGLSDQLGSDPWRGIDLDNPAWPQEMGAVGAAIEIPYVTVGAPTLMMEIVEQIDFLCRWGKSGTAEKCMAAFKFISLMFAIAAFVLTLISLIPIPMAIASTIHNMFMNTYATKLCQEFEDRKGQGGWRVPKAVWATIKQMWHDLVCKVTVMMDICSDIKKETRQRNKELTVANPEQKDPETPWINCFGAGTKAVGKVVLRFFYNLAKNLVKALAKVLIILPASAVKYFWNNKNLPKELEERNAWCCAKRKADEEKWTAEAELKMEMEAEREISRREFLRNFVEKRQSKFKNVVDMAQAKKRSDPNFRFDTCGSRDYEKPDSSSSKKTIALQSEAKRANPVGPDTDDDYEPPDSSFSKNTIAMNADI